MSKKSKNVLHKILFGFIALTVFDVIILTFADARTVKGKILSLLIPAIIISVITLFIGSKSKCPNCKKLFALQKVRTELIKEEDVNVRVETKNKNLRGEVIGTGEQFVPGKRKTYKTVFVCKKCGENAFSTWQQDVANI